MTALLQDVKSKSYRHGIEYAQNGSQPQRDHPSINYYSLELEPDP